MGVVVPAHAVPLHALHVRQVVLKIKDSGAVSKLPAGDVDWDKYEILPDGNWYSFVKNGQRYYISYSDVGH